MSHITQVILSCTLGTAMWFILSYLINLITPVGFIGTTPLLGCILFIYFNIRRV